MKKQLDVFGDKKNIIEVEVDDAGNIIRDSLPHEVVQKCGCKHSLHEVAEGKYPIWVRTAKNTCNICKQKMAKEAKLRSAQEIENLQMIVLDLTMRMDKAKSMGFDAIATRLQAQIDQTNGRIAELSK